MVEALNRLRKQSQVVLNKEGGGTEVEQVKKIASIVKEDEGKDEDGAEDEE